MDQLHHGKYRIPVCCSPTLFSLLDRHTVSAGRLPGPQDSHLSAEHSNWHTQYADTFKVGYLPRDILCTYAHRNLLPDCLDASVPLCRLDLCLQWIATERQLRLASGPVDSILEINVSGNLWTPIEQRQIIDWIHAHFAAVRTSSAVQHRPAFQLSTQKTTYWHQFPNIVRLFNTSLDGCSTITQFQFDHCCFLSGPHDSHLAGQLEKIQQL